MRKFLFILIILPSILFAHSSQVDRIHAHLLISDPKSACQEAEEALQYDRADPDLWQAYIKALAKAGDEQKMLEAWRSYTKHFPEDAQNRDLIETMAWGVIEEGARSSSPIQRIIAMIAAHLTRDIKGDELLRQKMKDSSTLVRRVALQLAMQHRDPDLADQVLDLFRKEKNGEVRLEAIKAIGPMHIGAAEPELLGILSRKQSRVEEKLAAIQSLANLYEGVDRSQAAQLTRSDRMGLRMLGCYVIRYFGMHDDADLILPLLNDSSPLVRAEALQTLGLLKIAEWKGQSILPIAENQMNDPEPLVAVSAAWFLTLHDQDTGKLSLAKKVAARDKKMSRLAASALATTGRYGLETLQKTFATCSDPYSKLNLSIGLISQRTETEKACDALYHVLKNDSSRWMWKQEGIFRVLCPSDLRHNAVIPNYPEAVNQSVRLELLNILAIMQHPGAPAAVKQYLQEHQWGLSSLASSVLLTEGDEEAVELVKGLINDPNPKIRMEAALLLALWGKEERAVDVLKESYLSADRNMREKILEGIGQVGSMSSVPFLVEVFEEPSPSLRMIAASSLLLCLYH